MIKKIKNNNLKNLKLLFSIILIIILISFSKKNIIKLKKKSISNINELIQQLNLLSNYRVAKNYLFSDLFTSRFCFDKNAYYIFEYYLNNDYNAYYLINSESDLYISLLKQNKTKNLILYTSGENIYEKMFPYLLNSKIIIESYIIPQIHLLISKVPFIKFLRVNHGVRYFKPTENECPLLIKSKRNTIASSPLEYRLLYKNYDNKQIFNAGLARWDRFNYIKKNESEKKCILFSFSRREYDGNVFEKSLYKQNLEKFFNNINFIDYLKRNDIELIYIPHHRELFLGKKYTQNMFNKSTLGNQSNLEHYIERCSIFVTDFSSLCFDFFFQNKPVLFYFIDDKDALNIDEKSFYKNKNDYIYFGNVFDDQESLIEKIKFYINKNFQIENEILKQYDSLFFQKKDIINNISNFIEIIISEK